MRRPMEPSLYSKTFAETVLSFLVLAFGLICTGCGGGSSSNSIADGGRDTTAPTVSITDPIRNAVYTSSPILVVSGTSSDSGGVVSVSWSSGGRSGFCNGTTSWTAHVELSYGQNRVTIAAKDAAGNTGARSLTVTYGGQVTLSGTVLPQPNVMVDSDVNETNRSYASNDSFGSAQAIRNPVTLGGYVNVRGSGASGRSYSQGDWDDYFSVLLSEGDSIALYISDYDDTTRDPDLSLMLYDGAQKLVAASLGPSGTESIDTEAIVGFSSGLYYVRVNVTSGATNYLLSVRTEGRGMQTCGSDRALSSTSDFVPGQVIIRFRDQGAGFSSTEMPGRLSSLGMRVEAGRPDREVLTFIDPSNGASGRMPALEALGVPNADTAAVDENTQMKLNTLLVIKALRSRPDVESADPNYIIHTAAAVTPNDPSYPDQWNIQDLPWVWGVTTGNSNVRVAVVDTGILLDHPDLSSKLVDGYDFVRDMSKSNDGDGIDADPDDPGDRSNADGSSSFHGTHVAGIVAAQTNNGAGIAGVNWGALVMPMRVLGLGGEGTSYDVLQGVRYAAGLENDSGETPPAPADIINLSLEGEFYSEAEAAVYAAARNAGVLLVAAAGDDGDGSYAYPASYPGVVSVSATARWGITPYSNYNPAIDVAAPGGDASSPILSLGGDDSAHIEDPTRPIIYGLSKKYGTSMAAPHVAGVAALMKAVRPTMTPDEFEQYLMGEDSDHNERSGYGVLAPYLLIVQAGNDPPTAARFSPASLILGSVSSDATVTISKFGSAALKINSVSIDKTWLTITSSPSVDDNGLGTYVVHVDRTDLPFGNHAATITFTDTDSRAWMLSVEMRVEPSMEGDAPERLHVLLIDADTGTARLATSGYRYSFNVSMGIYIICAGTDRDNDGYIGDPGEAFGAYISADQSAEIIADRSMADLDFALSYRATTPGASAAGAAGANYQAWQTKKAVGKIALPR